MDYLEPVYRPPSEASSLILQVTEGCSHNRCTFCGMYKDKKFRIRTDEEITRHIDEAASLYPGAPKIFLADGNVLCMPMSRLTGLLAHIRRKFTGLQRISMYASPGDVLRKGPEALRSLKDAGVDLVYVGAESGSEEILRRVQKGSSREEIIRSGRMLQDAGIRVSVTLVSGLGGTDLWREHAEASASMMNEMQPDYLSLLTLMAVPGTPLHDDILAGNFQVPDADLILEEIRAFVAGLELRSCVFRSNHASNYLPIGGNLPDDKQRILGVLDKALEKKIRLKEEGRRRL